MTLKYLAVEKDDIVHDRESRFWLSRGISSVRVSSMSEGIKEAMKQQFLYIGINAANIYYQPQLPLLREVTNDPIFISTTTYTMQEQGIAVSLGADLFGQISENPNDNFDTVMANINALQTRSKRRKPVMNLILYGNILLAPKHHKVYVNDDNVRLTKTEFELLLYFITNRGQVLSAEQIYSHISKSESAESIDDIVRSSIKRLRKKVGGKDSENFFIENIREVGYRLPEKFE